MSEGVQYLAGRYAEAEAYFSENYRLAVIYGEADKWSSNPAGDPNNIWDDAFSRYNTGRSIYSPDGNKGERNCKDYPRRCAYAAAIRKHMREKPWE